MEEYEKKILKEEYEADLEVINEKLEKTAINLNALHYEVGSGFGFWDDYGKRTKKLIKESKELWIQKSFIEKKLEDLKQSTLDGFDNTNDEEEEVEISEDEIESAADETEERYED